MKLRLLNSIARLGLNGPRWPRSAGIPLVKSSGGLRMRHFELADYRIVDARADIDIVWTPGPAKARLKIRESLLPHLQIEQFGDVLTISSRAAFDGDRPSLELGGPQLSEIHLGGSCCASVHDLRSNAFIASAFGRSSLRAQGHARELHIECQQEAAVDCASLICELAIAELSGASIVLLRAEAALQAETRDSCHLFTIGSPLILDVRRRPS